MDSFEWSKIAGAVFAALLLIFVPKTIIDMRQRAHQGEKPGYALPEPAAQSAAAPSVAPAAGGQSEAKATDAAKAAGSGGATALASANAENGKASFTKCAACHTAQKGAANGAGPNLWNVLGRKAGSIEGFSYSESVKKKGAEGFVWDHDHLLAWVQADDKVISGNKMIFPGIKDAGAAADLIAYIATLSDSPAPPAK